MPLPSLGPPLILALTLYQDHRRSQVKVTRPQILLSETRRIGLPGLSFTASLGSTNLRG